MKDVLVVGGAHGGEVVQVGDDTTGIAFYDGDGDPMIGSQRVRRIVWVFPGRTDRQAFSFVAGPSYMFADVWRAALAAWAQGWAPPDSASIERTEYAS